MNTPQPCFASGPYYTPFLPSSIQTEGLANLSPPRAFRMLLKFIAEGFGINYEFACQSCSINRGVVFFACMHGVLDLDEEQCKFLSGICG